MENRLSKRTWFIAALFAAVLLLTGCAGQAKSGGGIALTEIPVYSGSPSVDVNGGVPVFDESALTTTCYEKYGNLDALGRCTGAEAVVGQETMPTQERGDISSIKPSGWRQARYDCVNGGVLYNRCHLIGYQLTGENANEKNLITGTRYMNVDGMLPYEDAVATYVKTTGNHVAYRVTPIYEGDELVARGVQMEAESVEDRGYGVSFNVYCYNVQPGVEIDYANGDSWLAGSASPEAAQAYVLNTKSKKFHKPDCKAVPKIAEANKENVTASRAELSAKGYSPCGICNP